MSVTAPDQHLRPETPPERKPRVDPAGRPLEHRLRQAIFAVGILIVWVFCATLIMRELNGDSPAVPSRALLAMAVAAWLIAVFVGGRHGLVWPASALGITGSISLGIAASLATPEMRAAVPAEKLAVIAGVASLSMMAFLFRFRLPGLVSPVITFGIVALFLTLYGTNTETLSQVEGFSARGILAAMMSSPIWVLVFGAFAAVSVNTARRLDLQGDDFGLACARPLHLVGAGVLALVVGRAVGAMPTPVDALLLIGVVVVGCIWGLRINRFAVMAAVHLAVAKPLVLAFTEPLGLTLGFYDWMAMFFVIILIDLVAWPFLHHISLERGWTLGPGGRIPRVRDGWLWRFWPYA